MYINFVLLSYLLCCLATVVKSWHKQNRPKGEFKQGAPAVFHVGLLPRQKQFNGRAHIFTNPPPPVTTPRPTRPTTSIPPVVIVTPKGPHTTQAYDWNAYFATPYPSTKKGYCPDFDTVHANCYGRCHTDDDCFYDRKCCRDGYGFGCCIDPLARPPPKPAVPTAGFFDSLFGFGPTTTSFFWKKR